MTGKDDKEQGDSSRIYKEIGPTTHFQCPILKGTNYTAWVIRMQVILEANGLWGMIKPHPTTRSDAKKDKTAIAYLYQSLPEVQLLLHFKVQDCKSSLGCIEYKTRGCRQCPIETNLSEDVVMADLTSLEAKAKTGTNINIKRKNKRLLKKTQKTYLKSRATDVTNLNPMPMHV
ncbi:zinc finger, CCHC-type containing protein [Tanacetum coccineum]